MRVAPKLNLHAIMGDDSHLLRYLPLYRAALTDDWETAECIFNQYPDADTAMITLWGATALHIAVGSNSSHRFVDNLVNRIAAKDVTKLRTPDNFTYNSLHYAAIAGNTKAAITLVNKDPEMVMIANDYKNTAVKFAASYGRKKTLEYLLSVTPNEIGEDGTSPYSGLAGGDLITHTIIAGFYDVALTLIKKYPNLATEKNRKGNTALQTLATQPKAFPSGRDWWLWQYVIYYCIPISSTAVTDLDADDLKSEKKLCLLPKWFRYVCFRFGYLIWKVVRYLFPLLKHIHDTKLKHRQTHELMNVMVSAVLNVGDHSVVWDVLGTAISTAAKHGIHELIEECSGHYPGLIWFNIDGMHLFWAAIKYRQVKVHNLVYQMTWHNVIASSTIGGDNPLHLVARKSPPHTLNTVTGAALQMQRELQWFKEVEKWVQPSFKEDLNKDEKTPQMVFTDEHMDLVEKGEKWVKDTASSSMVVAALIVTVAFAAVFTVPGGNNEEKGTPFFLRDSTFMLFAISDAVALFSSVTSVLMFLAMLTSRYAEGDFLYALPKRITIGLLSLFISIAAIVMTFCAALALVLREELAWIAIPIGLIACVPVTFFALLQFPLLVELVLSTYGPSIFRKQNSLILH